MPAPPARTEICDTYPLPDNATARTGFGKLWDYVTGLLGTAGAGIDEARGSVAMHATTMDLWAQPNIIDGTGSAATVTAIANAPRAGARRVLYPIAGSIITNGATFAVDGAANHTAAAGDKWEFEAITVSTFKVHVTRASGQPVAASMPRSYLAGLTLSNNGTDPTNDIDIAVGECRDSTHAADIVLASALTKRLDAAWAVGTNQGGLDTGSIADTTYHVWLIKRSDTGVVDALFSTSATAPTMPANYDYKRRIGSIVRASAAIKVFSQSGNLFLWSVTATDWNVADQGATAVTRAVAVPSGVAVEAIMRLYAQDNVTRWLLVSSLSASDETPASTNAQLVTKVIGGDRMECQAEIRVLTNTSAQVRTRSDGAASAQTFSGRAVGWIDTRGRDS